MPDPGRITVPLPQLFYPVGKRTQNMPASLLYKRARSTAGKVLRAWNALHKSATDSAAPGFRRNMWGQYWPESKVDRVVSIYRGAIEESADEAERFALSFSLAALYQQALRLDESAALCIEVLLSRPDAVNFTSLLARTEAARGNLPRAMQLANEVDTIPGGKSFHVSIAELIQLTDSGGII